MKIQKKKKNPIAERFQFNMCNRKTGESVKKTGAKKTQAKKTQSILQVWRFFRFYVGRAFSLWEKL